MLRCRLKSAGFSLIEMAVVVAVVVVLAAIAVSRNPFTPENNEISIATPVQLSLKLGIAGLVDREEIAPNALPLSMAQNLAISLNTNPAFRLSATGPSTYLLTFQNSPRQIVFEVDSSGLVYPTSLNSFSSFVIQCNPAGSHSCTVVHR